MCKEDEIELSTYQYGIVTSPNYPQWTPNTNCMLRLKGPNDKTIRVYITDLNTEMQDSTNAGTCRLGYLTLKSGTDSKTYCGDKLQNGDYVFLSCTNTIEIIYASSSIVSTAYRGFNLYYEGFILI